MLKKQKPDARIKITPLVIFFFIAYFVQHLQPTSPHQEINVCSRSQFFTVELINKFESLYTSKMHWQSVFQSTSNTKYTHSNSYNELLTLLSGDIILNTGSLHNRQELDHDEWNVFKHGGLHFLKLQSP